MIIVRLAGGLGNQMFEYACGRALSLKNGVPLKLDLEYLRDRTRMRLLVQRNFAFRDYDLDVFTMSPEIAKKRETPLYFLGTIGIGIDLFYRWLLKPPGAERHFHFDPEILRLGPVAYLDGQWQSPKYFAGYEDVIRADFTLKGPFSEKTEDLAREIEESDSLCVHVRRGDFVNNPLHFASSDEYFKKALAEMQKRGNIQKIYVFSDDLPWCKENLHFDLPTMFVGMEYAEAKNIGHFHLMTKCKYFIIPSSTFSWWAAWLSARKGKIVIAPKQWYRDASIDTRDVCPSDWVRI